MKVAVLDDDRAQLDLISAAIGSLGHDCRTFERGRTLLAQLRRDTFDLMVLDWHLPDMNGLEVLIWIRANVEHRVPILFVTNQRDERSLVDALNEGADDYIVKPVRVTELKARVNALLRRSYPSQDTDVQTFGPYRFDLRNRSVELDGKPVELKQKEYELAHTLFVNVGRLLSRKRLMDKVWGADTEAWSRSLDTHVSRLRSKLGLRGDSGFRLITVYGFGYRLEQIEFGSEPDPEASVESDVGEAEDADGTAAAALPAEPSPPAGPGTEVAQRD